MNNGAYDINDPYEKNNCEQNTNKYALCSEWPCIMKHLVREMRTAGHETRDTKHESCLYDRNGGARDMNNGACDNNHGEHARTERVL